MALFDASEARSKAALAAAGAPTDRALSKDAACKLLEAFTFAKGIEDVRGHDIEPSSFRCEGEVVTTPTVGKAQFATVPNIRFRTRGVNPRELDLMGCLTHPVDDSSEWWGHSLSSIGKCFKAY